MRIKQGQTGGYYNLAGVLQRKLALKPEQFRAVSGHLQQADDDLRANGAREIYRQGLVEAEE